ncbi:MAG: WecB/TagA/CpsF family glycosyltransferase [Parcubacteria group bacterium]|jgi:N-acetylglucosaminyldiphosphoundecaprenol N-acetyl-beta-D-mannosaminyltransferase
MEANCGKNKHSPKVLGIKLNNLSGEEINRWLCDILSGPPRQKFVVTLNPEIILEGRRDEVYGNILNNADLCVCDGIGVKLISLLKGVKVKARKTGVEITEFLLAAAKKEGRSVLIIAKKNGLSDPEEIRKAVEERYGVRAEAACFDDNLLNSQKAKNSEIILVNFGAPQQEKFIIKYRSNFPNAKILVGVGGAIDFLTGKTVRAPHWMRKAGLEWFWRFMKQPRRIKRIASAVLVFPAKALINFREK